MRTTGEETASLVAGTNGPPQELKWFVPVSSNSNALSNCVTTTPEYAAVYFYKANRTQRSLYLLGCVATCGALPVVAMWLPQWFTRLTKQQVASIDDADFVLVRAGATELGAAWDECALLQSSSGNVKWFEYRKRRHFYDPKKQVFTLLKCELQEKYSDIDKRAKIGFTGGEAEELGALYGLNEINIAPMPWRYVLLRKVLHPFYLFQVASALIWLSEQYTTYSLIILAMSALSIAWEVVSQVSNDTKLHDLVKVDASVKVLRDQHVSSVAVSKLVVGDIVLVDEGIVPADVALIAGECTADESTLTGEAIPITKQALDASTPGTRTIDATLKTKAKECVLFAGSTVLAVKADNSTRGVVLATGFSTSKGELFRSILYPKPINFKIERDSYLFLGALSFVALLAFIKRLVQASKSSSVSMGDAVVSSLDLVTIAVPPALPLILTIGVGFALTRLEAMDIFCINSQRINLAGHVDCFCFDKTGTLSCDHLDFQGVDECSTTTASFVGLQSEVDVLSITSIVGLATCHALNERNGNTTGYALERDMFGATGYSIETNVHKKNTPNAPFSVLISSPIGKTFGIVKRYLFDASLQRSSVLIEDFETGQRVVYTKGSPETMLAVCNATTIPANYLEKVRTYSYQGYYVVALASKTYPVTADVPLREAMECRLNFLGFILFLNKIKTESPYVISTLEDANVDVRIITGDNAFTAIHVARQVNMKLQSTVLLLDVVNDPKGINNVVFADVDDLATQSRPEWTPLDSKTFLGLADNNEFAITGTALDALIATQSSLFVEQIVLHTKIFSRIRPHQKTWIVETLIQRGKCVGMVGDGTNDCGALKAAHVGIALSDADASIVAPFTSRKKSITDVVELLREGRCALSTSFVAFKFMVLYSIIQLTMSSLMNDFSSQMSNNQFLFDDLVVVFGLSVLMVRTASAEQLTKEYPAKSLFAPTILCSLGGQLVFLFICLGIAISAARSKSWFCSAEHALELTHAMNATDSNTTTIEPPCYVFSPGEPVDLTQHSYENSVIWLFGHLQYWIVALAFNVKDLFRKPFYTNKPFVAHLFVLFIVLQVQLFSYKSEQTTRTMSMDTSFGILALPKSFCTSLFFLFLFDLLLALVWELVVVGAILSRFQQHQRPQRGHGWFIASSAQSVSPYDREGLFGGEYDEDDGTNAKGGPDMERGRRKSTSDASKSNNDDDDDEEQDVLNQLPEIVYVECNSS
ncbi:P-type atpase, partial [Globisporangium splendens]